MKNSFVMGSQVYLRPANISDAKGDWYKWLNDPDVTKFLTNQFWPNTKEKQIKFVKETINNKDRLVFSICLRKNDKHIGQCSLSGINWVHRYADIALLIGDKKFRKSLYTLEVYKLLFEIAFNRLNLLNIKSATANPIVKKIHKLQGFRFVGSFKNLLLIDNKKTDLELFELSNRAWNKNK